MKLNFKDTIKIFVQTKYFEDNMNRKFKYQLCSENVQINQPTNITLTNAEFILRLIILYK